MKRPCMSIQKAMIDLWTPCQLPARQTEVAAAAGGRAGGGGAQGAGDLQPGARHALYHRREAGGGAYALPAAGRQLRLGGAPRRSGAKGRNDRVSGRSRRLVVM